MNLYEKIMILDPNLDENGVNDVVERAKEKIIKQGGEILKTENWGSRRLAYQLKKQEKGFYLLLLFKAPPSTILDLEHFARVSDAVIKIMVVRISKKKQVEAVMASVAAAEQKQPAEEQPAAPSVDKAAVKEEA
jgi:small subunit ribosomal protein S6